MATPPSKPVPGGGLILDAPGADQRMDTTKRRQVYRDLARAMVEDATWVFLLQQVDIYASRDRLSWTPRTDRWMPLHEAALR